MQIILKYNVLQCFFIEWRLRHDYFLFNLLPCLQYNITIYMISITWKFNIQFPEHTKICSKSYFYIVLFFFVNCIRKGNIDFLFWYRRTSHQTKCLIFYLMNIRQNKRNIFFFSKLKFFLNSTNVSFKENPRQNKINLPDVFFFILTPVRKGS